MEYHPETEHVSYEQQCFPDARKAWWDLNTTNMFGACSGSLLKDPFHTPRDFWIRIVTISLSPHVSALCFSHSHISLDGSFMSFQTCNFTVGKVGGFF